MMRQEPQWISEDNLVGVGMPAGDGSAVMTPDILWVIREQRLGFVATVKADSVPKLLPKGTFAASQAVLMARVNDLSTTLAGATQAAAA